MEGDVVTPPELFVFDFRRVGPRRPIRRTVSPPASGHVSPIDWTTRHPAPAVLFDVASVYAAPGQGSVVIGRLIAVLCSAVSWRSRPHRFSFAADEPQPLEIVRSRSAPPEVGITVNVLSELAGQPSTPGVHRRGGGRNRQASSCACPRTARGRARPRHVGQHEGTPIASAKAAATELPPPAPPPGPNGRGRRVRRHPRSWAHSAEDQAAGPSDHRGQGHRRDGSLRRGEPGHQATRAAPRRRAARSSCCPTVATPGARELPATRLCSPVRTRFYAEPAHRRDRPPRTGQLAASAGGRVGLGDRPAA